MRRTFECLQQLDDVGVVQHCHRVDLLQEESFQLWVFDHFALGDALDGVVRGRGGGLRGEEDVSEPALAQPPDGVELVTIEDVLCLGL